ncbi:MAG: hypothetical protein IKS37_11195 [Solobacterium sp.]|nr:hypothetical protein [Solobacterium sp.]
MAASTSSYRYGQKAISHWIRWADSPAEMANAAVFLRLPRIRKESM